MTKILNLEAFSPIDRDSIAVAIATLEPISIGYSDENNYDSEVSINDLDSGNLEALKKVLDFMSFSVYDSATIWNIDLGSKTFSLGKSYVRDAESTELPVTEITAGTPLIVQIETPSFTVFNVFDLSLWYDQDFDAAELTALEALGITVTGNGKEFTISNTIECRVYFKKPDVVTNIYVINNAAINQIISV